MNSSGRLSGEHKQGAFGNLKNKFRLRRVLMHLGLIAGALVMVYPLLWMISGSLKPEDQIFESLSLWSRDLSFNNYAEGWSGSGGISFGTFFLNSFIVSGASIVGTLISCSMAAYAFARINFKFKKLWFVLMLVAIMLPFHATVIPQYIVFNNIGWVDTFLPLLAPKFLAVEAFFIFLMIQFIRGIPRDLDESAQIDGCGKIQVYWRIILPLAVPALVTTSIFTFIWTYNDFFSQLVYLSDTSLFTVALGLRLFLDASGDSSWGPLFAMATLSLIPLLLFFVFFQRLLVEGVATTGLKG